MPDFDFDAFNHDQENEEGAVYAAATSEPMEASVVEEEEERVSVPEVSAITANEGDSVDDWKI
jgi:hypothetical protein